MQLLPHAQAKMRRYLPLQRLQTTPADMHLQAPVQTCLSRDQGMRSLLQKQAKMRHYLPLQPLHIPHTGMHVRARREAAEAAWTSAAARPLTLCAARLPQLRQQRDGPGDAQL